MCVKRSVTWPSSLRRPYRAPSRSHPKTVGRLKRDTWCETCCIDGRPSVVFVQASVLHERLRTQTDSWLDERVEWNKRHPCENLNESHHFCCKVIRLFNHRVHYIQGFIQRARLCWAPLWLEMWQCPPVFKVGSEPLKMLHDFHCD